MKTTVMKTIVEIKDINGDVNKIEVDGKISIYDGMLTIPTEVGDIVFNLDNVIFYTVYDEYDDNDEKIETTVTFFDEYNLFAEDPEGDS